MHVLVTGGAGYVGSELVPTLIEHGHKVRVLDKLRFGGQGLLPFIRSSSFEFIDGDVRDDEVVGQALKGVDAIIHLAAIVGYPACDGDPDNAWTTNVHGTESLLRLRSKDQPMVFASTGSVYGAVPGLECNEETPPDPLTLYGRAKAAAEESVQEAGNAVSFRFATAFGVSPLMRLDLLPNSFVKHAIHEGRLVVYQGEFRRTFIHVRDMSLGMMLALEKWDDWVGGVFNLGHETMNVTKADLARQVQQHVDYDLQFAEYAADPDQRDYEVSYAQARSRGFELTVDLDTGIQELVQAVRMMSADEVKRYSRLDA